MNKNQTKPKRLFNIDSEGGCSVKSELSDVSTIIHNNKLSEKVSYNHINVKSNDDCESLYTWQNSSETDISEAKDSFTYFADKFKCKSTNLKSKSGLPDFVHRLSIKRKKKLNDCTNPKSSTSIFGVNSDMLDNSNKLELTASNIKKYLESIADGPFVYNGSKEQCSYEKTKYKLRPCSVILTKLDKRTLDDMSKNAVMQDFKTISPHCSNLNYDASKLHRIKSPSVDFESCLKVSNKLKRSCDLNQYKNGLESKQVTNIPKFDKEQTKLCDSDILKKRKKNISDSDQSYGNDGDEQHSKKVSSFINYKAKQVVNIPKQDHIKQKILASDTESFYDLDMLKKHKKNKISDSDQLYESDDDEHRKKRSSFINYKAKQVANISKQNYRKKQKNLSSDTESCNLDILNEHKKNKISDSDQSYESDDNEHRGKKSSFINCKAKQIVNDKSFSTSAFHFDTNVLYNNNKLKLTASNIKKHLESTADDPFVYYESKEHEKNKYKLQPCSVNLTKLDTEMLKDISKDTIIRDFKINLPQHSKWNYDAPKFDNLPVDFESCSKVNNKLADLNQYKNVLESEQTINIPKFDKEQIKVSDSESFCFSDILKKHRKNEISDNDQSYESDDDEHRKMRSSFINYKTKQVVNAPKQYHRIKQKKLSSDTESSCDLEILKKLRKNKMSDSDHSYKNDKQFKEKMSNFINCKTKQDVNIPKFSKKQRKLTFNTKSSCSSVSLKKYKNNKMSYSDQSYKNEDDNISDTESICCSAILKKRRKNKIVSDSDQSHENNSEQSRKGCISNFMNLKTSQDDVVYENSREKYFEGNCNFHNVNNSFAVSLSCKVVLRKLNLDTYMQHNLNNGQSIEAKGKEKKIHSNIIGGLDEKKYITNIDDSDCEKDFKISNITSKYESSYTSDTKCSDFSTEEEFRYNIHKKLNNCKIRRKLRNKKSEISHSIYSDKKAPRLRKKLNISYRESSEDSPNLNVGSCIKMDNKWSDVKHTFNSSESDQIRSPTDNSYENGKNLKYKKKILFKSRRLLRKRVKLHRGNSSESDNSESCSEGKKNPSNLKHHINDSKSERNFRNSKVIKNKKQSGTLPFDCETKMLRSSRKESFNKVLLEYLTSSSGSDCPDKVNGNYQSLDSKMTYDKHKVDESKEKTTSLQTRKNQSISSKDSRNCVKYFEKKSDESFSDSSDENVFRSKTGQKYIIKFPDDQDVMMLNITVNLKDDDSNSSDARYKSNDVVFHETCQYGCNKTFCCLKMHKYTKVVNYSKHRKEINEHSMKSTNSNYDKNVENSKSNHICVQCSCVLHTEEELFDHICPGKQKKGILCVYCEMVLNSKTLWSKHQKLHFKKETNDASI